MQKPQAIADCLYVNGDSWTHGSELIDPTSSIQDHFDTVHETYRLANYWPKLVADQLGIDVIDGSKPGASNDRILRTTVYDVSQLIQQGRKPFIVVAWTQLHRFELPAGPEGHFWRSFVSPLANDSTKFAKELWREWSSDRTDVVKWAQQLILLDSFLKVNQVNYLGTTVFNSTYRLYEQYTQEDKGYFESYLYQLRKNVNLSRHALNISLETYLNQQLDVTYGPGGHPLKRGHQLIAEQITAQINSKFQFYRQEDQTSAT